MFVRRSRRTAHEKDQTWFALMKWKGHTMSGLMNGAGENRTPVPIQSTIHVYASSQVFNLGTVSLHLTN